MRNPTLWESASRPLFVRTVWLEGSELRSGLQKHFIWDYDTSRSRKRLNANKNSLQVHNTPDNATLKRSISLVFNDFTDFDNFNVNEEGILLIGSAKKKLHEPSKLAPDKKEKFLKYSTRPSIYNQRSASYDSYLLDSSKDIIRRTSDASEIHAIKNSFTQTHKLTGTAEELLAERVLHWLDLAGRDDFLKNLNELKEMEVKLSKTSKLRQDAIKRYHNKIQNTQNAKTSKTRSWQRVPTAAAHTATQRNGKSSEPVKHITIIFKKEGQPVRLNRPAKNIDLCTLSTSPATTRRLAGTLASTRLYKSADNSRCANNSKISNIKPRNGNASSKSTRRRLDTVADLTSSTLQKRLHENPAVAGYNNLLDAKKQLHIFMPTLLKKGLNSSVYGTEDGISELSHNFSEMCKI